MITPASQLKKKVSLEEIAQFLEDYIMEKITEYNNKGSIEMCAAGYDVSVDRATGKISRGLGESRECSWYSLYNQEIADIVLADFRKAGYRVYTKGTHPSIWIGW